MEQAEKTPLEDLRNSALADYELAANAIHHWNNFIVDAIKNYNPEKQGVQAGVEPANDNIYKIIIDKKEYYEKLLKEEDNNKDYIACFVCEKKIEAIIEIIADSLLV